MQKQKLLIGKKRLSGMKRNILFYIIILILLSAAQCRKENAAPAMNPSIIPALHSDSLKTFLALGDSYTIGQSINATERFPDQTARLLSTNGITMAQPKYIAMTGWTTDNLAGAINLQMPAGNYDVVTLLIGVNDQYQRHDTAGYRERFTNLLKTGISLAGNRPSHVFVLSIPDYSVTPFANNTDTAFIRMQIDLFNMINQQITVQETCNYLYITALTREAKYDLSLLATDGLHPSGKEYGIWAALLAPLMSNVLR